MRRSFPLFSVVVALTISSAICLGEKMPGKKAGKSAGETSQLVRAEQSSVKPLLANPGFERFSPDGRQPIGWELRPGATVEKGAAKEGEYYLRLSTVSTDSATAAIQRSIPTVPGKYYRLVYNVRSEENPANTTGFARFQVYAAWDPLLKDGESKQNIQQLSGRTSQDTFSAWQERSLEFFAPDIPSAGMVLICLVEGPGTVWLDNFRLQEAIPPVPPAFRLSLDQPYYRGTIYADAPVSAIQGVAKIDSTEVTQLEMTMGLPDAPPVFREMSQVKNRAVEFSIPAKTLPDGAYQIRARGLASDGREVSAQTLSVLKVPAAPHTVRVSEDNVFLVDGKPFFPVGIWRMPSSPEGYDEKMLYDFNRAGINTFLMQSEAKVLQHRLDQAAKYHLMPMFSVWDLVQDNIDLYMKGATHPARQKDWKASVDKAIAPAANHPALFGYYFADEPLWNGFPLAPIRAAYDYFRQADPNHPIYINEAPRNTPAEVAGYAAASDFFGLDIYPVSDGNSHSDLDDKTLTCVGKYTDRMREAVDDRKPVVMTLQGFAWAHLANNKVAGVYPTLAQSRFMAYDAILHGATGLMYWGTDSIVEESFWQTLFRVTSELRDMGAVLTSPAGKPASVTCPTTGIVFLHKVCDGQDFIIAANESQSEVSAVFQTQLPHESLHVVFEDRMVAVTDGIFGDAFAPQSVHIYASTPQLPPPLLALALAPDPGGKPAYLTDLLKIKTGVPYDGHASWIWAPGKSMTRNSRAFFRQTLTLPTKAATATLIVTADDRYVCYLNGKEVGRTMWNWSRAEKYDVTALLRVGTNTLSIVANDAGSLPCGLLADLTGETVDGKPISVMTDAAWWCTESELPNWTDTEIKDDSWVPVHVLGPYGSGAWGKQVMLPKS